MRSHSARPENIATYFGYSSVIRARREDEQTSHADGICTFLRSSARFGRSTYSHGVSGSAQVVSVYPVEAKSIPTRLTQRRTGGRDRDHAVARVVVKPSKLNRNISRVETRSLPYRALVYRVRSTAKELSRGCASRSFPIFACI